jgi:hypothetical protein
MKKFSLIVSIALLSQSVFAAVPTKALTFATNVEINAATSASRKTKIETAAELIKEVVSTDEFRNQVLNFTYSGRTQFNNNDGYTNAEIYQIILDGAEELNKSKDNEMDLPVVTYYESSSTVGYTSTDVNTIYMNTKFLDQYTAAEASGNMMHEWLHKLGFSHSYYYSSSRDYSVPYAIGYIMENLAKKVANGSLVGGGSEVVAELKAPTALKLTKTTTKVTLKWTAAVGAKSYKVYRVLSGSTVAKLQSTLTGTSFTQTKPTKSAKYYVRSVNAAGDTAKSASVSYTK